MYDMLQLNRLIKPGKFLYEFENSDYCTEKNVIMKITNIIIKITVIVVTVWHTGKLKKINIFYYNFCYNYSNIYNVHTKNYNENVS